MQAQNLTLQGFFASWQLQKLWVYNNLQHHLWDKEKLWLGNSFERFLVQPRFFSEFELGDGFSFLNSYPLCFVLFCFAFPHAGEVMIHVKHTSAIKHNDRVLSSFLCDFDQISSCCSWKKESRFDKPSRLEWRQLPEESFNFTWYMIGLNPKP